MEKSFFTLVRHPFKFRLFLLKKLPAAFFAGIRIQFADERQAVVTVKYQWLTTNPFRSTYFACLNMAAEMSTGILAMANIYQQTPAVSMLVVQSDAVYYKKAVGITRFTCEDGAMIKQAVREAMASGKSVAVTARAVGKDAEEAVVAECRFTWSFKVKSVRPKD
jgi:Domain of unknown function (DUF4442)